MSGRGVGGMGAGCAGFSLIGLLLGVGLTLWLGAKVLEATGPVPTTAPSKVELAGTLSVAPNRGLVDGASVTAGTSGLERGPLEVSPCLTPDGRFAEARCDRTRTVPMTPDPDGQSTATLVVDRVITVDGADVDCGRVPETCSLVAHAPGSAVGPAAPLTFEPG